jgi:hypothetical protein
MTGLSKAKSASDRLPAPLGILNRGMLVRVVGAVVPNALRLMSVPLPLSVIVPLLTTISSAPAPLPPTSKARLSGLAKVPPSVSTVPVPAPGLLMVRVPVLLSDRVRFALAFSTRLAEVVPI